MKGAVPELRVAFYKEPEVADLGGGQGGALTFSHAASFPSLAQKRFGLRNLLSCFLQPTTRYRTQANEDARSRFSQVAADRRDE